MPVTTIGGNRRPLNFSASAVIDVKRVWEDPWRFAPQLEFVTATTTAAAQDLGSMQIRQVYGKALLSFRGENVFTIKESDLLIDHWVRLRLLGGQTQPVNEDGDSEGGHVAWVGRVSSEARAIHPTAAPPSGVQTWTAYEPAQILRKIHVYRSHWLDPAGDERVLATVHDFNAFDDRNLLVGNRSPVKSGGTYLYGGTDLWTRFDALEYILGRFVDESGDDGPEWSIGGQVSVLQGLDDDGVLRDFGSDVIRMDPTQTVAKILGRLISIKLGFDYTIRPTEDGFEVFIYVLHAEEQSFGDVTLPRNPNTVEVIGSHQPEMREHRLVHTADQRYDQITLLGRRIVVCLSLRGKNQVPNDTPTTLVPKWGVANEATYDAGTGTPADGADAHDEARQADALRSVYGVFGAPEAWDFNNGEASPLFDSEGKQDLSVVITPQGNLARPAIADFQPYVRATLLYLPLQEGFDYTADPPKDMNAPGHVADFMPPAAWILDGPRWVGADAVGFSVHAAMIDWGVYLATSPRHLLAMNHFAGAAATETEPAWDYDDLIVTIALEADQRLTYVWETPDDSRPSGGQLVIEVPDAELWYLARDTVLGTDIAGNLLKSGDKGRVLRNDTPRLMLHMAGAIARYFDLRSRAQLTFNGLMPAQQLLGQILTVIEEGEDTHHIQAAITAVTWDGSNEPATTIRTGFAS